MSTWYRAVDASWDDHLKTFGKTQRKKMRRWCEKVEQTDGLKKILPESAEQVDLLLDALIQLHQQRWTDAGQPGSYADPVFREFIHQASRDFFRRGRLHLPTLQLDQKTIGGELHFVGEDQRLYCYSSGYDIQSAELEPGRILAAETLRDLYRMGLEGIDYMRGDEPYKQRMSASPARLFRFRVIAGAWLPRLRHAAWCTQFELKQWVRRQTGRRPLEVADLSA
jgi:CelD/BcsL family acetyltransferase involved in cellulose biosynthesis